MADVLTRTDRVVKGRRRNEAWGLVAFCVAICGSICF